MRSLLQFLALCATVSFCICYDESRESMESTEDLVLSPNQANSFITPQRGHVYSPLQGDGRTYYNRNRNFKSPAEMRVETCEDYYPCRYYAHLHGYQLAYQRYFAPSQSNGRTLPRQY